MLTKHLTDYINWTNSTGKKLTHDNVNIDVINRNESFLLPVSSIIKR